MSVASAWKKHEQAVADFFFSERTYDHLTHRSQRSKEAPSDVLVTVSDWLLALKKITSATEPWNKILIECKYRKSGSEEGAWLRKFFAFMDKIPASVDSNKRKPVLFTPDGWLIFRLGHFYAVYRAILASSPPGKGSERYANWLIQLSRAFWLQSATTKAPRYFEDWLDVVDDVDHAEHGNVLPVICLGSSARKKGPGGGKVVIVRLGSGVVG